MGRRIWTDACIWSGIRKLPHQKQELYMRLFISPSGNIAGYYKLNPQHLAAEMDISEDELIRLLNEDNGGKWYYDDKTEQVLLPEYSVYNQVCGSQQVKKLNAELEALVPCPLHKEFVKVWKANKGVGAETLLDHSFLAKAEAVKGLNDIK